VDYYQGIVADYLTTDPAMFVQPESCISLDVDSPLVKDRHWYCDALAVSFRTRTVYLCEVTFDKNVRALMQRLRGWDAHWAKICASLRKGNSIPEDWEVRPWVFVPETRRERLTRRVNALYEAPGQHDMPRPLATSLEDVVPWLNPWPQKLPGDRESDV
jgi:hypothetical protein